MIEVSEFKKGICIRYKDAPMTIVEVTFSTPTARGGATIAKTKFRNLLSGQLISESVRSGGKYEPVDMERRPSSFLYSDGTDYHFMDGESFEQFALSREALGDLAGYLKDGLEGIRAMLVEGAIVSIELPNTVDLTVIECDPTIKGATAQAQLKKAVVETGIEVQVPSYIEMGEQIRVDTRDGHFVERVKK
ncbi:elongation factor P [Engelhardtia mirabilis]|uniref:Elongation factor P n=1 Tax=Engelhardtia mirabilis TaxID=2528011 RepID=A0A518BR60_9BACT|nr:Elongation factor P [Planctomycetes bacterium Pla133]QDV03784.1 Elongation factor P [Planctomycetes bacterium Pla86]